MFHQKTLPNGEIVALIYTNGRLWIYVWGAGHRVLAKGPADEILNGYLKRWQRQLHGLPINFFIPDILKKLLGII